MISFPGDWMDRMRSRLLAEGAISLDDAELTFQEGGGTPLSEAEVKSLMSRTSKPRNAHLKPRFEGLENRRLLTAAMYFWSSPIVENADDAPERVAFVHTNAVSEGLKSDVATEARQEGDWNENQAVTGEIEETVCELAERITAHWLAVACDRAPVFADFSAAAVAVA